MSEYQYVEFRAVDRPLTDAELDFARKQSSRAEISRWSFCNEYHYGDFGGDAKGLLRRGYDVYLHYANFGVRNVAFRLPAGLPFPKSVWSRYVGIGELSWEKDRSGDAGILWLSPFHEAGELDEIWDFGEYVDALIEVRRRLVEGDPRALYAAWLCAASDDQSVEPDVVEPPVPADLSDCAESLGPFMEFFGLDPLIVVAAGEAAPDAPEHVTHEQRCRAWIDQLAEAEAKQLLNRFLTEGEHAVKAETVAAIRQAGPERDWPTVSPGRTFEMLLDGTAELRDQHEAREQKKREAAARREAAKQERQRQERMKEMINDPQRWLREATQLVDARGTDNYKAAAEILADLREAVGGDEGTKITRNHAAHLAKKHPTLNHLKSSLRKRGLLE